MAARRAAVPGRRRGLQQMQYLQQVIAAMTPAGLGRD